MQYLKSKDGEVFAFDSGVPRSAMPDGLAEMSPAEVESHLSTPAVIPAVVSRFQARRALKDAGEFDRVEAAIAEADEFTQDAWADAQEFRRDSALILSLGESLGLDLDPLFIAAAKIEA